MKLGIVTISYNQGRYLRACLESVVAQLEPGDEYVVVDPGSTDGSREIIRDFAQRKQVTRAILERDNGPADGLNRGFAATGGEILAYLNSDDFYLPGAFSHVRRYFAKRPDVDALVSPVRLVDQAGLFFWRGRAPSGLSIAGLAAGRCYYVQQGTFFRAENFRRTRGFNADNRTCWDFELMADLLLNGARVKRLVRPLGAFRIHAQSLTGRGNLREVSRADMQRIQARARDRVGRPPKLAAWEKASQVFERTDPIRRLSELLAGCLSSRSSFANARAK